MRNRINTIFLNLFFILFLVSCNQIPHDSNSQIDPESFVGGAIYISCEDPPWAFDFRDIIKCQFDEPAMAQLNPSNACALQTIQKPTGHIEIWFSDDIEKGRMLIRVSDEVEMTDIDGNLTSDLYVDDEEPWFLTSSDTTIEMHIINAYIGGCFHELIRWKM